MQKTKYCVQNSGCHEPLQFCDKTGNITKLYGTCRLHLWVWITLSAVIAITCFSCISSIVCCLCGCCRKAV